MTEEELNKVKFHCVCHLSMESEHATTYESENGRLGFRDHVPFDENGEPHGRAYRHFRIDNKVYKTKKKFIEALKDFNP
jgi:hypothetical protein